MQHRLKVYLLSGAVVAVLVIGIAIQQGVFAQDDSDNPTTSSTTAAQEEDATNAQGTDANAEAAVQYMGFIETVAANLGVSDPMVVDGVIKDVLTQVVDEQLAAGELADDAASALHGQIESGNVAPLIFGQAEQGDSGTGESDTEQDDGSGAPQAPTEAPDDDIYDY
jgi:hypothetical protein